MNELELRMSINGIDYGVAYKGIGQTEYRAAVLLVDTNDMMTLLE